MINQCPSELVHEQKEVPTQLDRIGDLLEELDKGIVYLQETLQPILHSDVVIENDPQEMKEPHLVPVADTIRQRCKHVKSMIQRVSIIQQGIQV